MRIVYGTLELANDTKDKAAGPLTVSTSGMVQEARYIGATNAAAFDRQNYRTTIDFSVVELHATLTAAQNILYTRGETLKTIGLSTLTLYSTGSTAFKTLINAKSERCIVRYRGVSVTIEYAFSGEYLA